MAHFVDISFTRDIGVARVAFFDSGTDGVNMGRIGIFKKLWLLRSSCSVGHLLFARLLFSAQAVKHCEIQRLPSTLSRPY